MNENEKNNQCCVTDGEPQGISTRPDFHRMAVVFCWGNETIESFAERMYDLGMKSQCGRIALLGARIEALEGLEYENNLLKKKLEAANWAIERHAENSRSYCTRLDAVVTERNALKEKLNKLDHLSEAVDALDRVVNQLARTRDLLDFKIAFP